MTRDEQDSAIKILREEINRTILNRPLKIERLEVLTYWYKKIVGEL